MKEETRKKIEAAERIRRWRITGSVVAWILAGAVLFGAIWTLFCVSLSSDVGAADVIDHAEFYGIPAEGVGRDVTHDNAYTTHGDALDYNINSTLWGWDGHGMEVWEMDLFARIAYLEFWGTSPECCEAGVDSILRLWELGEYGTTIGELLMAQYAPGCYVYSPMAYVWDWQYDEQGLANIRALCEERFTNGPEWCAPYFRLWYYHDWAVPAYEIDGVYFSTGKGW